MEILSTTSTFVTDKSTAEHSHVTYNYRIASEHDPYDSSNKRVKAFNQSKSKHGDCSAPTPMFDVVHMRYMSEPISGAISDAQNRASSEKVWEVVREAVSDIFLDRSSSAI